MKSFDIERVFEDERVVLGINIALGLLLLGVIAFALRGITTEMLTPKRKPPMAMPSTAPKVRAFSDYSPIAKKNPFGPPMELTQLSGSEGKSATIKEFTLIGVVSGAAKYSYAIFADKTGSQEVFRIGQDVFGAGRLKEVKKDRVVIDSQGKTSEIEIADLAKVEIVKSSGQIESIAKAEGGAYTIEQRKIQQALENPKQIMSDARLLPNIVNGKQEGFIVRELKPEGLYASLGLQNGDILLRINELELSSAEAALQAITALQGLDRIQLDLIRGGSRMTLTYQIK